MASTTRRVVCRLLCRLKPLAFNPNKKSLASEFSSLKSPSLLTAPIRRTSRLPLQLGSVESLMPLHSAVASARLISSLSIESQHWGLVPQEAANFLEETRQRLRKEDHEQGEKEKN